MTKLDGNTPDLAAENIEQLRQIFPDVFEEGKIDFDKLKQVLGEYVDDEKDRYNFTWNGKGKALRLAQTPTTGTLRPCEAESKNWDDTQNLYIEGDNLEVLKLLQKSYHGKIKMIYIDPPYNTGGDFVYPDDFTDSIENYKRITGQVDDDGNRLGTNTEANGRYHTDWLNMMYPRLRLARNLLSNNGVMFISIDEHEVVNLRKLCNEIFGENNFAGEIIWKNSSKNDEAYVSVQHEYVLCYVKDKNSNSGEWTEPKEGITEIVKAFDGFHKQFGNDWEAIHKAAIKWYGQFPESNPIYSSKHYSWMDEKGIYFAADISGPNFGQYRYDVLHPVTGKPCKEPASGWRYPESTMKERIAQGLIHFGKDETTIPNNKVYLADTLNQSLTSVKYKDGRVASKLLTKLMGTNCFSNPKDVGLLSLLMKAVEISSGDSVLDFFSGSGSTAEAVMRVSIDKDIDCKFIAVQLPENLDESLNRATGSAVQIAKNAIQFCDKQKCPHLLTEIGKERIRRAGEKIKAEIEEQNAQLKLGEEPRKVPDIGFKVFKLDSSNLKQWQPDYDDLETTLFDSISNYVDGRSELDVVYEIMLKMGMELTWPLETHTIGGKNVYEIGMGALMICLDDHITTEVAEGMAALYKELAPETWRVVFKDNGFADDSAKVNIKEILKTAGLEEDAFTTV